jgi:hypothetical protein
MKFLAIEKEIRPIDPETECLILRDEAKTLYDLYRDRHVREYYFNQDHEAVLILECGSTDECNTLLQSLPLVKQKVIRFELMELRPYTGFERLFDLNQPS